MILVEILNKLTNRQTGIFMVCGEHLAELKATHIPDIFNFRYLTRGFQGECQMCAKGETTPISFDRTPENFDLFVTFENDEGEGGWSASGRIGHLDYITDNQGNIYNTQEALYSRGVRKIYIEAGFELHLDE
ncbi:hypothetical protein F4Z99_04130 [Candidatus Poribacteria bacterium]|nr:hypothetical protein [Candidatus Poribacteria bacterium]MYB02483.1 hypothetical protein [Candidatus Poribacteria bacterium]